MNGMPQRERGDAKTSRVPARRVIEIKPASSLAKPDWIRVRLSHAPRFHDVKRVLREQRLHTVCEEASCPNIGECFGSGTATFMILGDLCTRRCPFCDVAHGRPEAPDIDEPAHLAHTVAQLALNHVVITSVDRDDLRDGGAAHFAACIGAVRQRSPNTRIEVLVPDFRGRLPVALEILAATPPDVLNHNLETVPRLYREARPGSDYAHSLELLRAFKARRPEHRVDMLTVGQYLQPRAGNLEVRRYVPPGTFKALEGIGREMGFAHVFCGALVRSSYHADRQALAAGAL